MNMDSAQQNRQHARRLREVYRSAGWPCQDAVEIELLAMGLLARIPGTAGAETVRVTDTGMAYMARSLQKNRQALSTHEALVQQVAHTLLRDGRMVWTNLSVRARLPAALGEAPRWKVCKPDVFSIRNTTVPAYLEPVVHEIKVSRADLLGDLKTTDKRNSYMGVGGQCWYVLGLIRKGQPIAEPEEIPETCGVLIAEGDRMVVARPAPKRPVVDLPFALWMALAKTPALSAGDSDATARACQALLRDQEAPSP